MSDFDKLMKKGSKPKDSDGSEPGIKSKINDMNIGSKISDMNIGSKIDPFVSSIKKGELTYILPPVSLLFSLLFIFTGFTNFFLSILYTINISFFAFIVRDSYSTRKENIIPLIIIAVSIFMTSIQMLFTLKGLADLANLSEMLLGY